MKKGIWVIIMSVGISTIILGGGLFAYDKYKTNESYHVVASVDLTNEYTIIGGVIRNVGDGWYLIQDESHETIGIDSISQDDKAITIYYKDKQKVNSIAVTVDETMASEGYTVGASVGVNKTLIYLYKDGKSIKPSDYNNVLGNVWIQGVFKK